MTEGKPDKANLATEQDDPSGESKTELLLAGDFGSPAEVLADNVMTDEQKRDIFDVWLRDLEGKDHLPDTHGLRRSIEEAKASLGSDNRRG